MRISPKFWGVAGFATKLTGILAETMPAKISPPFDAASLNVLAIDPKIACSRFDTEIATR